MPTLGGRVMLPSTANAAGPVDQRPVEARDDVLCFTTPVLTEPLEVTGHVSLTLFASSSAPDTDFTGKLVDVFPDGRAIFLTDGIIRARYRNSLAEPEPLTPGEPCRAQPGPVGDVERLPARAPDPARGLKQQLPALRPQHQHRRRHRRRAGRARRPSPSTACCTARTTRAR